VTLIDIPDSNLPLCPNSWGHPIHPLHQLHVRLQDAVYKATPHNKDGEPTTPELEAVNAAVSYGPVQDRMRLYRDSAGGVFEGQHVTVESWYFRCDVCGLILPANRSN
jgi:hypothetical protein